MDPRERDLGAGTAGVWTSEGARAAGLTPAQVRRRLEHGEWQSLRRGVYSDGGVVPDAVMRAAAAVLRAGDGAVVAGRTAARVWGIPLVDDHDPATQRFEETADDVVSRRARGAGPTLHATDQRLGVDEVVEHRGIRLMTPSRTLVDCARVLRPDALVAALDHALHHGLVTVEDLQRAVADRRWMPGTPALRAALALTDARAESPHESLTRILLLPHLPGLEPQVSLYDATGRLLARFDLGERALRLGVESDGARHHRGMAAHDQARDRRTGWSVERVTWFDTRRRGVSVVRRVLDSADRLRRTG